MTETDMKPETVLLGKRNEILEMPRATWEQHLAQVPQHAGERLSFMTAQHHRVRNFVVIELVKGMKPVAPGRISEILVMPLQQVNDILEDLERNLFFLVRNDQGAVAWAYPLTVEPTPHRLIYNTGEQLYAA